MDRSRLLHQRQECRNPPGELTPRGRADALEEVGKEKAMGSLTLRERPAWALLERHLQKIKAVHLRQLFADDPTRAEAFSVEAVGIYLDYSKNRITAETVKLLLQLAKECALRQNIDAMFGGEAINVSENRAVLHVALRAPSGATIMHQGLNVVPDVHAVL